MKKDGELDKEVASMRETYDQAVNVCEEEMHKVNKCEEGELEKK